MNRIRVVIKKSTDDGSGLASFCRPDGKEVPLYVPYTLSGEVVEVTPVRRKRAYEAELPVILTPSPARVWLKGRASGSRHQSRAHARPERPDHQRPGRLR